MSKHRKFNAERFLVAFRGHEEELKAIFKRYGVPVSEGFTVDAAYPALQASSEDKMERLVACLHELNDLSSHVGREIIEQVCESHEIAGPGEDITNPRAAGWLCIHKPQLFEHAMELLAVRSIQGNRTAIFPGKKPLAISNPETILQKLNAPLAKMLKDRKNTDAFEVKSYFDGQMFVVVVFCERTAEVLLEFGGQDKRLMSRVRRPAEQHVLLYNQSTGELEIEGTRAKEREFYVMRFLKRPLTIPLFFRTKRRLRC